MWRRLRRHYFCFCIWGETLTVASLWSKLESILPKQMFDNLTKIIRVVQRDELLRFEVFTELNDGLAIYRRVAYVGSAAHNWLVRPWRRQGGPPTRNNNRYLSTVNLNAPSSHFTPRPPLLLRDRISQAHRPLSLISLNVNGTRGSWEEFLDLIRTRVPEVVLLQETGREDPSFPLRIPGFSVAEVLASGEGRRGIAVAVRRKHLYASVVGQEHSNMLFVRIINRPRIPSASRFEDPSSTTSNQSPGIRTPIGVRGGEKRRKASPAVCDAGIIVGSVYVPRRGASGRRKVLETIWKRLNLLRRRFPHCPLVIAGDWNMGKEKLARYCAGAPPELREGIRMVRVSGSSVSWMRVVSGRMRVSTLDHVITLGPLSMTVGGARIDRRWDVSDHWPLAFRCYLHSEEASRNSDSSSDDLDPPSDVESPLSAERVSRAPGESEEERREGSEEEESWMTVGRVQKEGDDGWIRVRVAKRRRPPLSVDSPNFSMSSPSAQKPSVSRRKIRNSSDQIATHNYWEVLGNRNGVSDDDIDFMAEGFITQSKRVMEEVGVLRERKLRRRAKKRVSKKTKKACEKRRKAYAEWRDHHIRLLMSVVSEKEEREAEELRERYEKARDRARELAKKDKKESWLRWVEEGVELYAKKDMKGYWSWIRRSAGMKREGGGREDVLLRPIRNPEDKDQLYYVPERIALAWARHYGGLAVDVTTHSKDESHWVELLREERRASDAPGREELEEWSERWGHCDRAVSWQEVAHNLKKMRNGKAVGEDGIPAEWLKACVSSVEREEEGGGDEDDAIRYVEEEEEEEEEGESERRIRRSQRRENRGSSNSMAIALSRLINAVWEKGYVPKVWRCARVISIPKKGDLSVTDNYRGISLMSTTLKILCRIVAKRLSGRLEELGALVEEQAGFRSRDEAVSQAVTLWEMCKRRQIAGRKTYLAFLDLRKAYDTVPHEALFYKLRNFFGIPKNSRLYRFLYGLYSHSRISVESIGGSLEIPLERGLRQGCPISPVLFNMFINDVLRKSSGWAASIPGVEENSDTWKRCGGLLFADDLVLLAPSKRLLRKAVENVTQWCDDFEMSLGVQKCGVMIIGGSASRLRRLDISYHGEVLPKVSEYSYLGVLFHNSLSVGCAAEERRKILVKRVASCTQFLRNRQIPLHTRRSVLRTMLLPAFHYGSELWGMSQCAVQKAQTVQNRAMRYLCGVRASAPVSTSALHLELRITPMHVEAAARRARLYRKALQSRTWLGILVRHPYNVSKWTWVTGTTRWAHRSFPELISEGRGADWVSLREAKAAFWMRMVRRQSDSSSELSSIRFYLSYSMQQSSLAAEAYVPLHLASGAQFLLRARLRCLWTSRQLAFMRIIPERYQTVCPFCGLEGAWEEGENLSHILVECVSWRRQRGEHLGPWIARAHSTILSEEEEALRWRTSSEFSNMELSSTISTARAATFSLPIPNGPTRLRCVRYLLLGGKFSARHRRQKVRLRGGKDLTLAVSAFLQEVMPLRLMRLQVLVSEINPSSTTNVNLRILSEGYPLGGDVPRRPTPEGVG